MKIEAHRILRQFDKYRNRRKVPEKLDKWNFKIKERAQEKQRASLKEVHTPRYGVALPVMLETRRKQRF